MEEAEGLLTAESEVARVRVLLERGRVLNSSKRSEKARPFFIEAWEKARVAGADGHAVDAAHMMGIVEPPEKGLEWNRRAMALAESSPSPAAQRWLGSLYNNIGWTHHDQGDYALALEIFTKGHAWRAKRNQPRATRIARWSMGRAMRSLGRFAEALALQEDLARQWEEAEEKDGFVFEELAECLLALGREEEARGYFAQAYTELSKDTWLKENEPERLERIERLGQAR